MYMDREIKICTVLHSRASDNIQMYQEDCVPVTHDTIQGAVKWLWDLDRLAGVSSTACVEAVLRACEDRQNEAVYLYTEGSSIDSNRELLMQKVNLSLAILLL